MSSYEHWLSQFKQQELEWEGLHSMNPELPPSALPVVPPSNPYVYSPKTETFQPTAAPEAPPAITAPYTPPSVPLPPEPEPKPEPEPEPEPDPRAHLSDVERKLCEEWDRVIEYDQKINRSNRGL